ncbi:adenosylcobinamide-phosphate synthase CbiB [Planctomycetota bacterium]
MTELLILYAYLADLLFGDPNWFPHPVKGMGAVIVFLKKRLRGSRGKWAERLKGMLAALIVIAVSGGVSFGLIWVCFKCHTYAGYAVWVFFAWTTLATKDLLVHSRVVLKEITSDDLEEARKKLSRIVGRDTDNLSKDQIVRAVVESIAENTADGIVTPLFFLILGGPVCAVGYKAVNTLDSMIGHKDEENIHFGWFSARLDDIANYIPARITGLIIAAAAFILRKDAKGAFSIMRRDGRKHASPNSGIPEAAMAGALGVQLGGPCSYNGIPAEHPYIGEKKYNLESESIQNAMHIAFLVSFLAVLIGVSIRWIV